MDIWLDCLVKTLKYLSLYFSQIICEKLIDSIGTLAHCVFLILETEFGFINNLSPIKKARSNNGKIYYNCTLQTSQPIMKDVYDLTKNPMPKF